MKKSLITLTLLVSACSTQPSVDPAGTLPEVTGGPIYTLWAGQEEIPGIQGSYCDDTMCVDKMSHVEMIKESMMSYYSMSPSEADNLIFKVEEPASSVSFQVFEAEKGTNIECSFIPEKTSDTEYTLNLCDELQGEYILSGSAYYQTGGDGIYFYPISISQ